MKPLASSTLLLPLLLAACATAVTQDLSEQEMTEGGSAGSTSGGAPVTEGGKSNGTAGAGKAGSPTTNAFGGSASTAGSAGKSSGGAAGTTGSAGSAQAGSGGASAGSGGASAGTSSGGKAGSGTGGASAGAAGTGTAGSVGTGSCAGTAKFMMGTYAAGAKVVATCNGGTPCTLAKPAGQTGKSYEFSCTDQYNCGGQDPATTNWAQPPWQMTKACE